MLTIGAAALNPNGQGSRARPGRGRRWAWASPLRLALRACSLRCTLVACARGLRTLAAFILHCKKYMNSYMITAKSIWIHTQYEFVFVWIHIFKVQKIYEFILNSLYIWIHMFYEFIHSTGQEIIILPLNQTINYNACTTATPPHPLGRLFLF
jgi:hypothetical protein